MRARDLVILVVVATLETFGYRQLNSLWGCVGTVQALSGKLRCRGPIKLGNSQVPRARERGQRMNPLSPGRDQGPCADDHQRHRDPHRHELGQVPRRLVEPVRVLEEDDEGAAPVTVDE